MSVFGAFSLVFPFSVIHRDWRALLLFAVLCWVCRNPPCPPRMLSFFLPIKILSYKFIMHVCVCRCVVLLNYYSTLFYTFVWFLVLFLPWTRKFVPSYGIPYSNIASSGAEYRPETYALRSRPELNAQGYLQSTRSIQGTFTRDRRSKPFKFSHFCFYNPCLYFSFSWNISIKLSSTFLEENILLWFVIILKIVGGKATEGEDKDLNSRAGEDKSW